MQYKLLEMVLDAEVAFYLLLGFELSYNGEDFKAITYADCIEFGLSRKADVKGFVSKMKIVLILKSCVVSGVSNCSQHRRLG
jgi:hypothetical protein